MSRELQEKLAAAIRKGENTVSLRQAPLPPASLAGSAPWLVSWFAAASIYPKIMYRLRSGSEILFALGKCGMLSSDFDSASAACFRGVCFPGAEMTGVWEGFEKSFDHAPQLLLTAGDGGLEAEIYEADPYARSELLDALSNPPDEPLEAALKTDPAIASPAAALILAHHPAEDEYRRAFDQVMEFIGADESLKTVLARRTDLCCPMSARGALERLLETKNPGYLYFYAPDESRFYAGVSPERLFRRNGPLVETEALAGTSVNTAPACRRFESSRKNLNENSLVSDWIARALKPVTESVKVSRQEIIPSGSLLHMKRAIQGRLTNPATSDLDLIRLLHPTPAMAGCPQSAALELISRCENFSRGWYAGTMGVQRGARSEYCVLIRGIAVSGDRRSIFAGSGIVSRSDCRQEYRELDAKLASILENFGLAKKR
ncbi:MAG: chorismate-binding protein [Succinivibrionaceae bacterium]|nr:chorismate-binding protein [Succinivibrionaceae bacterium]